MILQSEQVNRVGSMYLAQMKLKFIKEKNEFQIREIHKTGHI